jgi:predicted  nucleic acid-binding Zn-ribbon protein
MKYAIAPLLLSLIVLIGCNEPGEPEPAPVDAETQQTSSQPGGTPVTQEDVREEAAQTVATAKELLAQEQQDYRKEITDRMQAIQTHIDALKEQLEKAPKSERVVELQNSFEQLEQRLADVRTQAEQETSETREAWEDLKTAVDEAVQQIEASAENARQEIDGGNTAQDPSGEQTSEGESVESDTDATAAEETPQ